MAAGIPEAELCLSGPMSLEYLQSPSLFTSEPCSHESKHGEHKPAEVDTGDSVIGRAQNKRSAIVDHQISVFPLNECQPLSPAPILFEDCFFPLPKRSAMEHHLFDIRSPRGGGYYDDYYDDYDYRWPLYIYIVISVLSFMAFLFFWSLVFYTVKGETVQYCSPHSRITN